MTKVSKRLNRPFIFTDDDERARYEYGRKPRFLTSKGFLIGDENGNGKSKPRLKKNRLREFRESVNVTLEELANQMSDEWWGVKEIDMVEKGYQPLWEIKLRLVVALNDLAKQKDKKFKYFQPFDIFPKKVPRT